MGSCVQGLFCNDRFQAVNVEGGGQARPDPEGLHSSLNRNPSGRPFIVPRFIIGKRTAATNSVVCLFSAWRSWGDRSVRRWRRFLTLRHLP